MKPTPFDRNVIAAKSQHDAPPPSCVDSLAASNRRIDQGAANHRRSHLVGGGFDPYESELPFIPEQELFRAVLRQAIFDAVAPSKVTNAGDVAVCRAQAREWFCANTRDFRDVCALAGFDPDYIRENALKLVVRADAGGGPFSRRKLSQMSRNSRANSRSERAARCRRISELVIA